MAKKKRRLTRNRHRNAVKNKRNAKPGLKHRFKHKRRKSKYWREQTMTWGTPIVIDWSAPSNGDGGVEACKARVAGGMKCYCLERCRCRSCAGCRTVALDIPLDECYPLCKTCSKHMPCR